MAVRIIKKSSGITPAPVVPVISNLEDVIEYLTRDKTLAPNRQRDLISACRSVARLTKRTPADLPADAPGLRPNVRGLHPARTRISPKRLSNLKADLAAALRHSGTIPPDDPIIEPDEAWRAFLARATQKQQAWALARFARFCTYRKIRPDTVGKQTLAAFRGELDRRVIGSDPDKIVKASAEAFNVIVRRAGLDLKCLPTARGHHFRTRPMAIYPASLLAEIDASLTRLEHPSLFSEDGPDRPLRPMTLRNIRAHLRQILDAAVEAGHPPERFKSFADLINLDVLAKAIEAIKARHDGTEPTSLPNILATLIAIARYHVKAPEDVLRKLLAARKKIVQRLEAGEHRLSPKTARRLEQFDESHAIDLLVGLPIRLMAHAEPIAGTRNGALLAMHAAAIAVLLACPMRINNLSGLRLHRDITPIKEGRRLRYLIHVVGSKVKNGEAIDAVIEPPLAGLVAVYVESHRRHLAKSPEDWLFPKRSGGAQLPRHFGEAIKQTIRRETGLDMNVHLFRHFAAKIFLAAHPGEYESVRRLLAHRKLETTTKVYAPLSNRAAFERYNDIIGRTLEGPTRRRRRP